MIIFTAKQTGSASGPRSGMCPVPLGEEQGIGGCRKVGRSRGSEDAGKWEGAGDGEDAGKWKGAGDGEEQRMGRMQVERGLGVNS